MQYVDKLRALKDRQNLTNGDIAQRTGIPLTTVTKIFNGRTVSPSFDSIVQIAIVLGASVDKLAGVTPPEDADEAANSAARAELSRAKDDRIRELCRERDKERREKHTLAIILTCVIGIVLVLLMIDVVNGHFGFIRY